MSRNHFKINKGLSVGPVSTQPADPELGDLIFNSTTSTFQSWNGTAWVDLGSGGSSVTSPDALFFGTGSDGDVTVTTSITLTNDMYYRNLTISGAGSINTSGYKIFVSDTLNLTAAGTNAITRGATSGNNGVNQTAGTAGSNLLSNTVGGGTAGTNGSPGVITGNSATSTAVNGQNPQNGGFGGQGGRGGVGSVGTGGNPGAAPVVANVFNFRIFSTSLIRGSNIIFGASGGTGGTGGTGDGTNSGGGGGAGGTGSGVIFISANKISTLGAASGAINVAGGAGGSGATRTVGNVGGGAGGGGAGGGWAYIAYKEKLDASATDIIDASGGAGGAGGSGVGTGLGAPGGTGGAGGRITIFNLTTNLSTELYGGTTTNANPASGITGGASVPGQSVKVSL